MSLGNPDQPVGGLAVRTPPGVELRPLGRDDFADGARHGARDVRPARLTIHHHRAAGSTRSSTRPTRRRSSPWPTASRPGWRSSSSGGGSATPASRDGCPTCSCAPRHAAGASGARSSMACIAEWRLRQGDSIMLEVGTDNVVARSLYRSLGFHETGLHFQLLPVRRRGVTPPADVELRPMAIEDFDAVSRLLGGDGASRPVGGANAGAAACAGDAPRRSPGVAARRGPTGRGGRDVHAHVPRAVLLRAPQAWIPELIVADRARGAGIGAALLDDALGSALERGAYACVLESGPQRQVAHRLYAAAGFTDPGGSYVLAA